MTNVTVTKTKSAANTTQAQIAATIHEQLGGDRFDIMTGAYRFLMVNQGANGADCGLFFSIPTARDGINRIRVDYHRSSATTA